MVKLERWDLTEKKDLEDTPEDLEPRDSQENQEMSDNQDLLDVTVKMVSED